MNLMTLGVLAGAYTAKNHKSYLTHAVEVDSEGRWVRVLCTRVSLDSICDDEYAVGTVPTCKSCAAKVK